MVEVLGVGDDLLVGELADHLGDVALLVGLLAVCGGVYGHFSCSRSVDGGSGRISARPFRALPVIHTSRVVSGVSPALAPG